MCLCKVRTKCERMCLEKHLLIFQLLVCIYFLRFPCLACEDFQTESLGLFRCPLHLVCGKSEICLNWFHDLEILVLYYCHLTWARFAIEHLTTHVEVHNLLVSDELQSVHSPETVCTCMGATWQIRQYLAPPATYNIWWALWKSALVQMKYIQKAKVFSISTATDTPWVWTGSCFKRLRCSDEPQKGSFHCWSSQQVSSQKGVFWGLDLRVDGTGQCSQLESDQAQCSAWLVAQPLCCSENHRPFSWLLRFPPDVHWI